MTDVPFANVADRSLCSRSGMLRSRAKPVLLLAVTATGNTPLEIVTDASFTFGTKVQTAPIAQVSVGVTMDAPELLTMVTWGFAKVMVMLVKVAEPTTVEDRKAVSDTN